MSFGVPLFLLALLAAGVPVVLHMINRQKVKDLPFPTLRFLLISAEKTRRRRRIQDLLLMLLRMAVLILLALGLAKPTVTSLGALWGSGAESAVAIVLDNSASMGAIDSDEVRFETALRAARQILDELSERDQVALLLTGGPHYPGLSQLDRTHQNVLQILDQCRERGPSYEQADLGVKINEARKLLSDASAHHKHIFVISDLKKRSLDTIVATRDPAGATATPDASREVPVVFIDCDRAPRPNVAIQGVKLSATAPVANMPVKATVELLNASTVEQERHVELLVDGTQEAASPAIKLAPGAQETHEFVFTPRRGGLFRGEARLVGDQGSPMDDRFFFTIQVDRGIPVAVIKPRRHEITYLDDAFYLTRALRPIRSGEWAISLTELTAADLPSEPLNAYKAVFCVNLPAPTDEAARRLADYAATGGNLFWLCGDNVEPDAYNRANTLVDGRLLPAPIRDIRAPGPEDNRDAWQVASLDSEHPSLRQFLEPPSMYQSILVYRYARLDTAAAPDARVLARLDDGDALLVERNVGRGRVYWLGTSAHVGWTNLPLRPIFLPLLARMVFDMAGAEDQRRQSLAGAPRVLQFSETGQPRNVEVQTPTGETIRLNTEADESIRGQTFRYEETHDPGVYLVRLLDGVQPTQIAYSVNVDPGESDPTKIDREELANLLGGVPVLFADDPEDLASTFRLLREGRGLWGFFLTGVLLALIFETLISNAFSPKQDDQPTRQPPAGMQRGVRTRAA
ncbi:MAG: BatA and WFA domain-containing protein [Patescibacteria group bacterium]|nr:BatA and WFA domain-containing protein [Patescibacteria group bacterium]